MKKQLISVTSLFLILRERSTDMAVSFSITNPVNNVELQDGKGEISYTVTNTTRKAVRARSYIDIDLKEGVEPDWFSVEDAEIRTFSPNETSVFKIMVDVPPDQEDKQPKISLGVCNVEKPQEDFKPGPAVSVRGISWSEVKPKKPWYIRQPWISIWIVLIVAAIAVPLIVVLNKPNYEGMGLVQALVSIDNDELELGDINWDFNDKINEKSILPAGTILRSELDDDEVTLWVQYWHPYDANTAKKSLGKTKTQREKNIDALTNLVEKLEDRNQTFPFKIWLTIVTRDRKNKKLAQKHNLPLSELGKRKVSFLSRIDEDEDEDEDDDE